MLPLIPLFFFLFSSVLYCNYIISYPDKLFKHFNQIVTIYLPFAQKNTGFFGDPA